MNFETNGAPYVCLNSPISRLNDEPGGMSRKLRKLSAVDIKFF